MTAHVNIVNKEDLNRDARVSYGSQWDLHT